MLDFCKTMIAVLLGGLLTYGTTINSIKKTAKLDAERREEDKKTLRSRLMQNLKEEIRDNLSLIKNIQVSYAKVRFLDGAYEMMKFHANLVHDSELFNKLREVHIEIKRFNSLAEYEQVRVGYGIGSLDADLKKQAEIIKNKIDEIGEIENIGN